jgi:FAD-dependent urate hydroxylase
MNAFSKAATDIPVGLPALEQRLQRDLAYLCWPGVTWMPERLHNGVRVMDVAIIGAGQAGLVAAAALQKLGIHATVLDRSGKDFEGPWATTARMETLRSPKQLTGPALGLPALTFRAWFEAQFGETAWERLDKIPRLQWMDYLRWYRRVMKIDVRNDTLVTGILPQIDGLVRLALNSTSTDQPATEVFARRVVLATGRDGLGGASVPAFTSQLQRRLWAHSSDAMDYRQLKGQRVGVVGAGSSAMDSAASALEAGAASVDLLIRRADIPRINKSKAAGVPGLVQGHYDLPDGWKWRIRHYINVQQVPPPRNSTQRVSRHANARFHVSSPIVDVQDLGNVITVSTPRREFTFDFLIVSTGFQVDWTRRPEYVAIAPHVRAWRDVYTPDAGDEDQELGESPYLGPVFELQEKTEGACPGMDRIHCFCYPATISHGTVSGDIPSISDGARRLASGIASLFYREDVDAHFATLQAFSEPEIFGDEWTPAP